MSSTFNQLIQKKTRKKKKRRGRNSILEGKPHKSGICVDTIIESPKKPNSAKRKIALVKVKFDMPGK